MCELANRMRQGTVYPGYVRAKYEAATDLTPRHHRTLASTAVHSHPQFLPHARPRLNLCLTPAPVPAVARLPLVKRPPHPHSVCRNPPARRLLHLPLYLCPLRTPHRYVHAATCSHHHPHAHTHAPHVFSPRLNLRLAALMLCTRTHPAAWPTAPPGPPILQALRALPASIICPQYSPPPPLQTPLLGPALVNICARAGGLNGA
jgi:hypothetical protein